MQLTNEPKSLLHCAKIDYSICYKKYFRPEQGVTYFLKVHNAHGDLHLTKTDACMCFCVLFLVSVMRVYLHPHRAPFCLCERLLYSGSAGARSVVFECFCDPGVCGFRDDTSFYSRNKTRKL